MFWRRLLLSTQGILCVQKHNREQTAYTMKYEPVHEISYNVVCASSTASDQPAHTRSLIRAFASRLNIL